MEVALKRKRSQNILPKDWIIRKLGDLGTFRKGRNIPKSSLKNEGLQCILYGEIYTKYHYKTDELESCIDPQTAKQSEKIFYGDILFAGSGETVEEIGKCIAYVGEDEAYAGGDIVIFRSNDVCPEYLGYALNSTYLINQKSKLGQGSSVIHIYARNLKELKILLPPHQEQLAIATALSDMDVLIQKIDNLIEKKQDIKKATMQLLLTGKKRLNGFDGEWEELKLKDAGMTFSGLSGKSKADFGDGNHPYIPFLNVINNPVIDTNHFDSVHIKKGESQNNVKFGDLLFNTSSETPEEVGMCSVLLDKVENLYLNSFCFGYRPFDGDNIHPLFLSYYFRSGVGRNFMFSLAQGSTRYNLSKSKFLNLSIKVPPLEEQIAIARLIRDMNKEIDVLDQKKGKYKEIKKGMMQELLTGKTRIIQL